MFIFNLEVFLKAEPSDQMIKNLSCEKKCQCNKAPNDSRVMDSPTCSTLGETKTVGTEIPYITLRYKMVRVAKC